MQKINFSEYVWLPCVLLSLTGSSLAFKCYMCTSCEQLKSNTAVKNGCDQCGVITHLIAGHKMVTRVCYQGIHKCEPGESALKGKQSVSQSYTSNGKKMSSHSMNPIGISAETACCKGNLCNSSNRQAVLVSILLMPLFALFLIC